MKRSPLRPIGKKRKLGVPKDVLAEVIGRDCGCVARSIVLETRCWGEIDPHHVLPKGRGGKDTADNLICLCRAHHDWVHNHPEASYALNFLRRSS